MGYLSAAFLSNEKIQPAVPNGARFETSKEMKKRFLRIKERKKSEKREPSSLVQTQQHAGTQPEPQEEEEKKDEML